MNRTYRPRPSITPVVIGMDMVEEARRLERDRLLLELDTAISRIEAVQPESMSYASEEVVLARVKRYALVEVRALRQRLEAS